MTKIEDFIATLHLIAAGKAPNDRQEIAIQEALAHFTGHTQQSEGGDHEMVRCQVVVLRNALRAASVQPRLGSVGILLDYARKLVTDWLDNH